MISILNDFNQWFADAIGMIWLDGKLQDPIVIKWHGVWARGAVWRCEYDRKSDVTVVTGEGRTHSLKFYLRNDNEFIGKPLAALLDAKKVHNLGKAKPR